jgi:hypothetical protein
MGQPPENRWHWITLAVSKVTRGDGSFPVAPRQSELSAYQQAGAPSLVTAAFGVAAVPT